MMTEQPAGQVVRFRLAISAEKYLAYYQGHAKNILVRAEDGRKIRFPAHNLRPFLLHDGIYGLFQMRFDHNNKMIELNRLDGG
ncbi:MAG: DUF2835 domain-containing protein [Gammaproteobacteria bacterium]